MRRIIAIIAVCLLVTMMFSGCGILQRLGLQKDNDELRPASSIVMNEEEAQKLTDKTPMHLYFATADNTKLKLEVKYIPVSEAKKSTNYLAGLIIKELINGPTKESGLQPTIPAGTTLRSVSVNAGVATVDFSKEFVDKHPGGKDLEQLTIYSVVNSLTELKDVQQVKFLVNGKSQSVYKGAFKFDVPFPRTTTLLAKENIVPGSVTASSSKDTKKQDSAKSTPTPKSTPAPKSTPKANTAPADPKAGSSIKSQADIYDEEAEATYLETLDYLE